MKIGVFDSGIGGEAVAHELRNAFVDAEVICTNDRKNMPYGSRTVEEVCQLTNIAIQPLLDVACEVIVLACNTATTAAIEYLRVLYPQQKFIGLEPMVKPAPSLSKTGVIAICATPTTLRSERYARAKTQYASEVTVIEPDCSDWASLIENNTMNQKHIDNVAAFCIERHADVIILGCTHYHWIKQELKEALGPKVILLEPTDAIIARVKQIMNL